MNTKMILIDCKVMLDLLKFINEDAGIPEQARVVDVAKIDNSIIGLVISDNSFSENGKDKMSTVETVISIDSAAVFKSVLESSKEYKDHKEMEEYKEKMNEKDE